MKTKVFPTKIIATDCWLFPGKPCALYDENNPDWAPSQHLGGAPEKSTTVAEERHTRAVLRKEKKRRSDACDALLGLSKLARMVRPNSLLAIIIHAYLICSYYNEWICSYLGTRRAIEKCGVSNHHDSTGYQ